MIRGSSLSGTQVWHNEHEVFTQAFKGQIELSNDHPGDGSQAFNDYNAQTKKIMDLLGRLLKQEGHNARARALGNGWSFSKVAATVGHQLTTHQLKNWFPVDDGFVDPGSRFKGKPGYLYFLQCGMRLFEITQVLNTQMKSLPVSGSSCNHTIVGAFSTGTHGAAFAGGGALKDVSGKDWGGGALHDYVRGLHIIVGPNRHVFLQRKSDPCVTADFAGEFGVDGNNFYLDDTLFDAAVVSFGSFGFIHGVMLEVADLFLLDASRYSMDFEPLQNAITNWNFNNPKIDLMPPVQGDPGQFYHFEVLRNPYGDQGAVVTVMHKTAFPPGFTSNIPTSTDDPHDDLASVASLITRFIPGIDTLAASLTFTNAYPPFAHQRGTIGQQNPMLGHIGPGSVVCSMGIARENSYQVMQICEEERKKNGSFIWYDIRFVPQAKGLLAFQRFPNTCVFEMVGPGSGQLIQLFNSVMARLKAAGIGFAFHWGKYQAIGPNETKYGWPAQPQYVLDPQELVRIYGANVQIWKDQRTKIFGGDAKLMTLFTNDLMVNLGLA